MSKLVLTIVLNLIHCASCNKRGDTNSGYTKKRLNFLFPLNFLILTLCFQSAWTQIRHDNLVVPLVAVDPYFNAWQWSQPLNEGLARTWYNSPRSMMGGIKVDGVDYCFMGSPYLFDQKALQKDIKITPTSTVYFFEAGPVLMEVAFISPHLPHDLKIASLPITYLDFKISSMDSATHEVEVYMDAGYDWLRQDTDIETEVSVNTSDYPATHQHIRLGLTTQDPLSSSGDMVDIDWGYMYLLSDTRQGSVLGGGTRRYSMISDFISGLDDDFTGNTKTPRSDRIPTDFPDEYALASVQEFVLAPGETQAARLILAFDDIHSINYFGQNLDPYWKKFFGSTEEMITFAWEQADGIIYDCKEFDRVLLEDAKESGGDVYADLISLAHRQVLSGGKIVSSPEGNPWFFHKENTSNGCIATVDVSFPASPYFFLLNPELVKAMIEPVMQYAESEDWYFDFAPHDLGIYPLATGQVYGGVDNRGKDANPARLMPVAESGNMLLLSALYLKMTDDQDFLEKYWPLLTMWAEYLAESGFDPGEQLCTDDFSGHLAHNSNLSLKTIGALGAYGQMCEMMKKRKAAVHYQELSAGFAEKWMAKADDGDHYRLAFDKPGTWSLKYNLIWDQLWRFQH